MKSIFEDFANETGRKLKLEVEPGTFLVAHAQFSHFRARYHSNRFRRLSILKVDAGMTEVLRLACMATTPNSCGSGTRQLPMREN